MTSRSLRNGTRTGLRGVSVALAIVLVLPACSRVARPGLDEWRTTWVRTRKLVPELDSFRQERNSRSLCEGVLGELHAARGTLFPAPNDAIEPTARDWLALAEDTMFACPTDPQEQAARFERLDQLARLVDDAMREPNDG